MASASAQQALLLQRAADLGLSTHAMVGQLLHGPSTQHGSSSGPASPKAQQQHSSSPRSPRLLALQSGSRPRTPSSPHGGSPLARAHGASQDAAGTADAGVLRWLLLAAAHCSAKDAASGCGGALSPCMHVVAPSHHACMWWRHVVAPSHHACMWWRPLTMHACGGALSPCMHACGGALSPCMWWRPLTMHVVAPSHHACMWWRPLTMHVVAPSHHACMWWRPLTMHACILVRCLAPQRVHYQSTLGLWGRGTRTYTSAELVYYILFLFYLLYYRST